MSLRRLWVALALVHLGCSHPAEPRWNVLLVTLDTTRADFLGCYGRPGNPTPRLDALARSGTRFDQALATAAVTPVSHAAILSGRDNANHGLRVIAAADGFRLRDDVPTLASVLSGQGYRTAAIHSSFTVSGHFGFRRGFDVFESLEADVGQTATASLVGEYQRRSDETTGLALDYLRASEQPFFLWVHFWDPHDGARVPPAEWLPPDLPRTSAGAPLPGRALYEAEVRYLDSQIGRLLDGLAQLGQAERTLVVVVADHGEGLGDHGWEHHRVLYQEQIRVPLIVRVPGLAQAADVGALVRTTDIYPTVLDYLGVAAPKPVDGCSLRALIEGRTDAPRSAFADQINGYDLDATMLRRRPQDDFVYAVVDAGWKLVYRPNHPEQSELFELGRDPGELDNRFAEERGQRLRLLRLLAAHAAWVTGPFTGPAAGTGAAEKSALAALGYAGETGAKAAVDWAWVCPEHEQQVTPERSPCPQCGAAPILVRRH